MGKVYNTQDKGRDLGKRIAEGNPKTLDQYRGSNREKEKKSAWLGFRLVIRESRDKLMK